MSAWVWVMFVVSAIGNLTAVLSSLLVMRAYEDRQECNRIHFEPSPLPLLRTTRPLSADEAARIKRAWDEGYGAGGSSQNGTTAHPWFRPEDVDD